MTAAEGVLFQDGPASTCTGGSLARILTYDSAERIPASEFVCEVDRWAEPSAIFGVNGIVEVLPIDYVATALVMERSFSVGGVLAAGTGNVVVINDVSTDGATDVLDVDALYVGGPPISLTPVSKRLVQSAGQQESDICPPTSPGFAAGLCHSSRQSATHDPLRG